MITFFRKWHDLFLFEYALFGLPWIVIGAVLPFLLGIAHNVPFSRWVYIAGAFFAARTAGMCLNRLIDCEIDQKNPRTKTRALPRGDITKRQVAVVAFSSLGLFFICCFFINTYTFMLSPLVGALLIIYSYTKRVTALCHFILGGVHFFAPIFAFAAISGTITPAPLMIGIALLCVIASGDIFYALQDVTFDQENGLYSIPAKLGIKKSLVLARLLQLGAVSLLICVGITHHFSTIYFLCCAVIGAMYVVAYFRGSLVFFMNSYVGIVMMLAFMGEYAWQKL